MLLKLVTYVEFEKIGLTCTGYMLYYWKENPFLRSVIDVLVCYCELNPFTIFLECLPLHASVFESKRNNK